MSAEAECHLFCRPESTRPLTTAVDFVPTGEFLADEPSCKTLWDLVSTQFRTRSKFLAVWAGVKYVAVHRDADGSADGFLLVNAPINWQIDYVVVKPESRGRGIAGALVTAALNQAYLHRTPYVMLTCRAGLKAFYEGCGFTAVEPAVATK